MHGSTLACHSKEVSNFMIRSMRPTLFVCSLSFFATQLSAQQKVSASNTYHRILATVPMIGAGTANDPRRPAYTPAPQRGANAKRSTIGFTAQISDDGRYALVEFVAKDPSAFKDLLADKRSDVKIFEKGKTKKEDIEREFKTLKTTIDLSKMEVTRP